MLVLGIDPSLNCTGWAILEHKNSEFYLIESGVIKHPVGNGHLEKILETGRQIRKLVCNHNFDAIAIEETVVNINPSSSLKLGLVRGAIIFVCSDMNIPVVEYMPKKIKLAIVGNGNAKKEQVEFMVSVILKNVGQSTKFATLDVSDAIAVAITHLLSNKSVISQSSNLK